MKLQDIPNYKKIIRDSYAAPGEGILLSHIWYIIELYNNNFTIAQKNLALILIMQELLKNNLVKVNKAYQKGENKPYWEEGYEKYIESLKNFLAKAKQKDLEKYEPEYVFVRFDYEFVDWQISTVDELEKFGL